MASLSIANIANLNVNEDEWTYWEFVKQLRTHRLKSQVQPSLRPHGRQPECVDFTLAAGHNSVIFRADKSDLYVCGYSRDNGAQFWEFAESSLVPGSRPLNFSRSYFGSAGFSKFGSDRHGLPLGYDSLFRAVTTLATTEDPNSSDEVQRCMLVVIQMISEAVNINPVAELVVDYWDTSEPLPAQMIYIQNALLMRKFNSGMLRVITDASPYSRYWRALLYVDSVRINTINGGNIHGTVEVKDTDHVLHIAYDRSRENPEKVGPGENLSLIGPSAMVCGEDMFTFWVDLWDGDIQIADGKIVFDRVTRSYAEDSCTGDYDKVLDEKVEENVFAGRVFDSVSVRYWVIKYSHSATVEVLMSSAHVHGKIEASYFLQKNSSSSTCLKLFDKSVDQYVEVGPEEHLPITRPTFPVPLSSKLTIQFNLVGQDGLALRDSWEVIPYIGTQLKNFTGECGNVQVLITFQ